MAVDDVYRYKFWDDVCNANKDSNWGGRKEKGKLLDWRNNEDDRKILSWHLGQIGWIMDLVRDENGNHIEDPILFDISQYS